MKAIVNITNKRNQHAVYNGLTFEVGDLLSYGVGLVGLRSEFPNVQTDFNFEEIIIVDIKEVLLRHSRAYLRFGFNQKTWDNLMNYCKIKNIQL